MTGFILEPIDTLFFAMGLRFVDSSSQRSGWPLRLPLLQLSVR